MPLIDLTPTQPGAHSVKKGIKVAIGIGGLAGMLALGSTLAASINLNSGTPVEFGQGIVQVTACDSNVVVEPISEFVNGNPGNFMFSGITLSDIDSTDQSGSSEGCLGKGFTIKALDSNGNYLQDEYTITVGSSGYSSSDGTITFSGAGTQNGTATLTFRNPTISARDVFRITVESSASWLKIYELIDPTRSSGQFNYVTGYGLGVSDAAASFDLASDLINEIRYRMELTVGATTYYADVSFDAWDGVEVSSLQIPNGSGQNQSFVLQRNVSNMSVDSNYSGVVTGTGLNGRLEIWPGNYGPGFSGLLPRGNASTYDLDDQGESFAGYGSFQVHNLRDSQTVLAWNNHGQSQPDVGFGNGDEHPDWTFDPSLFVQSSSWKLSIYVR